MIKRMLLLWLVLVNVLACTPAAQRFVAQQPAAEEEAFGYKPDRAAIKRFVASLPRPFLDTAGPELLADQDETPVLLFRAFAEAYRAKYGRKWPVDIQGIGDCTSFGWVHAANVHLAVKWKLGDADDWEAGATEAFYGGSRVEAQGRTFAGWADGCYGAACAKWASQTGGIVFRKRYDALGIDLTTYSPTRAKEWGAYGCGGRNDNGRLDELAKQFPLEVVVVRNFREAAAAIKSGYPVAVCSFVGFKGQPSRDADGFLIAHGEWAHCMCFTAVRFGTRPGLLCQNSWTPKILGGPKWPEDQPDSSFWVDAKTCDRMLGEGDSFAVSGYRGFPHRKLRHGDWVNVPQPEPKHKPESNLAIAL